ncbi:hypothetical protein G9A89_023443 [Geosiphon pyriformis]|nr:hypothetical protein G9A89_023443 [Geosiphon pyriformis]
MVNHNIMDVNKHFNTNHKAVSVFVSLNELLNTLLDSGANSNCVCSALFRVKKLYYISKLAESKRAEKTSIKHIINKKIESFEVNKSHTIKSVLECPFCKVVLDYLVVDNELVLKPDQVKAKVDIVMEGWTRKYGVIANVFKDWCH